MKKRSSSSSSSTIVLLFHFLALLFMALLTFTPETSENTQKQPSKRRKKQQIKQQKEKQKQPSSWDQFKNLLTCKQIENSTVHDPASKNSKLGSCSSICTFRDVVHGNTRVVHRADNSPESSSLGQETRILSKNKTSHHHGQSSSSRSLARSNGSTSSTYTTTTSSSRGMQFRKLSGCYECHMIVDPSRHPLPRSTICACPECGEVFPKIESLEHHQAVRHAVSELGPEDSSRNIVEIIFKSSWLKKDNPICKIERILKVHNTKRTIQRFEDCRDAVKIHAVATGKKNPRCAADGNELLRFYCTSLTCSLGARGSSSLCGSVPSCGVCNLIRHGFQGSKTSGVRTTASSGRAHDCLGSGIAKRRAMLVCRVIAGRVKQTVKDAVASPTTEEETCSGSGLLANGSAIYDSVAGYAGIYSNLEELYVFNPRAILPCFVVIYEALES
ncbi:PREDICTED: uncharacterized protein LOC109229312 [Nicotiana attenuata]|uniref:C2H2-type domain-containing protein n=1 Tax=Nicotiana attenuata TaxID=49451 RepID=A0A1J6IPZ9_NICAT|nr:PREDICTED: uncharacterized protein LOC109229312 [Nicotiana attenuata]OIT00915.1 hypothetical protein A4A49_34204 [Nicotiana attenuata]